MKLPRTRPIGRWGMLHKAYLKLRKPAYYQSLLLSGKLDAVLADVEGQTAERYEVLIEQMSQREGISEKLKEENQMEWVRRMSNLENRAEIVKQRVALYEQYADGNMSKEEFIRQRDAYRAQEDERMGQIQRLRTEKNQIFQPVKKDTDNLQAVMNTVREAGDVMHLSQNVVDTFIKYIHDDELWA